MEKRGKLLAGVKGHERGYLGGGVVVSRLFALLYSLLLQAPLSSGEFLFSASLGRDFPLLHPSSWSQSFSAI